jgi:phosphatidylglycerophosphatase A
MRTIKESSDELNPPVVTTSAVVAPVADGNRLSNLFALGLATCGVGYLPLAPGTFGSLVGVVLYLGWRALAQRIFSNLPAGGNTLQLETLNTALLLLLIVAVTLAGVWAATRAEKLLRRKDPGAVVVDEVAGQLITFLFVPLTTALNWWVVLAGFLLFRLFDIWKPYPARRMEVLEFGLGIMADDVVAGIYAAVLVALMIAINQLM